MPYSDLPTCDDQIFRNGRVALIVTGPRSHTFEDWIVRIRNRTGLSMDWHLFGGRIVVRTTGDIGRVQQALAEGYSALVDAYMTCPDNFTRNPEPQDVIFRWPAT